MKRSGCFSNANPLLCAAQGMHGRAATTPRIPEEPIKTLCILIDHSSKLWIPPTQRWTRLLPRGYRHPFHRIVPRPRQLKMALRQHAQLPLHALSSVMGRLRCIATDWQLGRLGSESGNHCQLNGEKVPPCRSSCCTVRLLLVTIKTLQLLTHRQRLQTPKSPLVLGHF